MRLVASDLDDEVSSKYSSLDFEGSDNEVFYARVWRVYAEADVVDPRVLMGHGAPLLLKHLATMGRLEIAARRGRMRELAPAMQWRLGRDVADAEPLDALQLALMSARQLGGPYGTSTSVLSHLESRAIRIPKG